VLRLLSHGRGLLWKGSKAGRGSGAKEEKGKLSTKRTFEPTPTEERLGSFKPDRTTKGDKGAREASWGLLGGENKLTAL